MSDKADTTSGSYLTKHLHPVGIHTAGMSLLYRRLETRYGRGDDCPASASSKGVQSPQRRFGRHKYHDRDALRGSYVGKTVQMDRMRKAGAKAARCDEHSCKQVSYGPRPRDAGRYTRGELDKAGRVWRSRREYHGGEESFELPIADRGLECVCPGEMKEDEKEEGGEVDAMVYVDLPPTRERA